MARRIAASYALAGKAGKGRILDELCATTGWHRSHARKVLNAPLQSVTAACRPPRPPKYDPKVIAALNACWLVLGMPSGKRLAPSLHELVPVLRSFGEIDIDDDRAALLTAMSAATIDRRLAPARQNSQMNQRGHTTPAALLKSPVPIRHRPGRDDTVPGFVEITAALGGIGNTAGEHVWTVIITDIATGWTERRSVPARASESVGVALDDIATTMPYPILGMHSGGADLLNEHLSSWCQKRHVAFNSSRPANSASSCQRNWPPARSTADHDLTVELGLLNEIWVLQSLLANHFCPRQKLLSKTRNGAKVSKKHDTATTPYRRTVCHKAVSDGDKAALAATHARINPAAIQRQIQTITTKLAVRA